MDRHCAADRAASSSHERVKHGLGPRILPDNSNVEPVKQQNPSHWALPTWVWEELVR